MTTTYSLDLIWANGKHPYIYRNIKKNHSTQSSPKIEIVTRNTLKEMQILAAAELYERLLYVDVLGLSQKC